MKKLELFHGTMSMIQYEEIHTSLPCLTEFQVSYCHFTEPFPSGTILPASSMTTLRLMLSSPSNQYLLDWPRYISRKYLNLKHLEYDMNCENGQLNEIELDALYGIGYPLMLQQVGSQLHTFHIRVTDLNLDIFKVLDRFGCRIKELCLYGPSEKALTTLGGSNLVKYIETFAIYKFPGLADPSLFTKMASLKSVLMLFNGTVPEDLELEFDVPEQEGGEHVEISLNDVLQAKTLESLVIQGAYINYSHDPEQQFHIKDLYLDDNGTTFNIEELVADCLPDLTILRLDVAIQPGVQYSFPNHHFSEVTFFGNFMYRDVAIETLGDKRTRFFSPKNSKS